MIELNMAKFNVKNPQTGEYEPLDGASQAKVQSDWNQTDNSAEGFIKNKPNLGTAASKNVDQVPTLSSTNLVESNGVAVALSEKADLENGKIPISQLPPAVIEKMVTVADDTARFALTINEVQLGDTVKVVSTNKMYMIIDTENLDKEAGYQVYVAGRAAEAVADQNGNTINTTYATTTDVETALMTKANKTDIVTYIAGSNISIVSTDNKIDLFEYAWSNVAPTETTTWQTIADSKSLTSAIIDLKNITKFKLQAATKQTHTIFISGAYVDSNDVLHKFPSSSLDSQGQIRQDSEIDVPLGYTGIRLVARLDDPRYQQGSEVHKSDFDYIRLEILEGQANKKIISAADQMQSDWNQGDNTSPDYIKNKPTIPAAQVPSDWMATQGVSRIINKPSLGTAAAKDYTTSVSGLSDDLITSSAVNTALTNKADLENGLVPISQLPPTVIERMVTVADDTARFALTTSDVQLGDTVKVTSTNKMYLVIDASHLDSESGYQVYVAGRAAEAVADQNGNTINTTYATVTALSNKVDKVSGKGLSTNDFDNTYKEKIDKVKTAWVNTRTEYDQLASDDYDLYFVVEG